MPSSGERMHSLFTVYVLSEIGSYYLAWSPTTHLKDTLYPAFLSSTADSERFHLYDTHRSHQQQEPLTRKERRSHISACTTSLCDCCVLVQSLFESPVVLSSSNDICHLLRKASIGLLYSLSLLCVHFFFSGFFSFWDTLLLLLIGPFIPFIIALLTFGHITSSTKQVERNSFCVLRLYMRKASLFLWKKEKKATQSRTQLQVLKRKQPPRQQRQNNFRNKTKQNHRKRSVYKEE